MVKKNHLTLLLLMALFVILPIKVSAASLLSSLEIQGMNGGLNLSKNTWNINFETSFDYVNITATPVDSSVVVEGDGKVSIQEGANQIIVTATSNGKTETFTINLNVVKKTSSSKGKSVSYDKDAADDIKNPETGAFLNVTLIAIAIISSLFVIKAVFKNQKFYRI